MPEPISKVARRFPLKSVFNALFDESGIDSHIVNYAWIEYASGRSAAKAMAMHIKETKDERLDYDPCTSPQEAHVYCHTWVTTYIAPSNAKIIELLDQAMQALDMFFQKCAMSDFCRRSCAKSDRDNPTKWFYHNDNMWMPGTDAHSAFIADLRYSMFRLPLRREHGQDSYRMGDWADFRKIMTEKIFGQMDQSEKPLDERQVGDGMQTAILGPSSGLLGRLYTMIGDAVHFFTVRNTEYASQFLDLFEEDGNGLIPTALLNSTQFFHTGVYSRVSFKDCERGFTELRNRAMEAAGGTFNIAAQLNAMITFSGYPLAVYKFKNQRIHVRGVGEPIDFMTAGREVQDMKFDHQYELDRENAEYVSWWLKSVIEHGNNPVREPMAATITRIKGEWEPIPKTEAQVETAAEEKSSNTATYLVIGLAIGAFVLIM